MAAEPVICHINLAKGFRGGERQTELLIRELSRLEWKQRLVVRKNSPLPQRVADVQSMDIVEVPSNVISAGMAARGSALVHAHEARSIHAGLVASLMYQIPYIGTRRVTNPFKRSLIRDLAYRRADCISVLSTSISSNVLRRYPNTRTEIIPSAHADFARTHVRNDAFVAPYRGKTVIGHVGALVRPHKGQHNIIDVARRWHDRRPNVQFVLVGSGKDEMEFRELADGLTNVEFAGQVTNVDDYLDLFDLFVFPSLMEGLGSTLLDAMCFGLPIVASNVGGIPDIIDDGVNGLLVEVDNSVELGDALERIINDPALQVSMREASLKKADRYSSVAMASSYDELYRSILN